MRRSRCRARVLTWGLFVGAAAAVLAPVGPGALVPLKMAIASADSVGNDVYVAVVVDFGSGSSMSSISKCVPVASTAHDADALAAAVGEDNVAYNNSGLLCAIDNYPANGVQDCGESVGSGEYDYWSYWHGASGSWVYANNGPAEQSVSSPADDVEGWRFQLDEPDNPSDPPPGVSPSYAQICDASTEVPPAQPPSATPSTTTSVPPSTTTTTGQGTSLTTATTPPTTQPRSGAAAKATPSTTSTSTANPGTPGSTGAGEHSASATHPAAVASSAAHHDAGGGGNALLPVVLVVAVVAALGGAALFRWRRRPVDE